MTHIAIFTSSRADWGLLHAPADALRHVEGVRLSVIAANTHFSKEHGYTVNEILDDGFDVAGKVIMDDFGDTPVARARAMAQCLERSACVFDTLRPDRVVMLGDRYEMLAAASAAAMLSLPIVHLHGGETSLGAIDDNIRHAITKLSSLHLTSTESHRRRVIAMGEEPDRVINTGAIGVWNALNTPLMSAAELSASLGGFDVSRERTLVVTYHPATADNEASPAERFAQLIDAIDRHPQLNVIITGANNDAGGSQIAHLSHQWAAKQPGRIYIAESLGYRRYLSALANAAICLGNSSSGIIEAPSMQLPTIDIGMRQAGRTASRSVLRCGDSADQISQAIDTALSPEFRALARTAPNPYYHSDTLNLIVDAIINRCPATTVKHFYDITSQYTNRS